MKTKRTPQTEKEVLIALLEMAINNIPETPEEVNELLIEGGLDPEKVRANAIAFSEKIHLLNNDWRISSEKITKMQQEYEENIIKNIDPKPTIIEKIKTLFEQFPSDFSLAHRNLNFDKLSENDLRSILQQMEIDINNKKND